MPNVFGRVLVNGNALAVASKLGRRVAKEKFLSNRDFLIYLRKESMSLLCLTWTVEIAVVTANVTTLLIDYSRERFMSRLDGK